MMNDIYLIQQLVFELKNLKSKIQAYLNNNDYVYANVFQSWVSKFNKCIEKYNKKIDTPIDYYSIDEWEYSLSQKTMRRAAIESFNSAIDSLVKKLEVYIEDKRKNEQEKKIPYYQVRRCFKLNLEGCPVNPPLERNKVFVGMPFSDTYLDSYNYGIKTALDSLGYVHFRADETISNIDIMCKICREIQSSGLAVFNISGLNPNVMLELGLAYGIGKPIIIVKDINTVALTDLGSIEYIEYSHAYDLAQKLKRALEDLRL